MADLDTRNKRGSAILIAHGFGRVFPNPDSSLANQSDRQQMAQSYAGIETPAVVTVFDGLTTRIMLTGVGN